MCEVTADGEIIVGRIRPKNNPLIQRSGVGVASFHNELPPLPQGYTFGAALKRDKEGAGDVMLTWKSHCANGEHRKGSGGQDEERDFKQLNKQSCKAKCCTPKEVTVFRKDHTGTMASTGGGQSKSRDRAASLANAGRTVDPSRIYGAPSAPSEHVAELIQNRFEMEWVLDQKRRHEATLQSKANELARKQSPTRSSTKERSMVRQQPQPHPREYFNLHQFHDIPSRYFTPSPTSNMRTTPCPTKLSPVRQRSET